MTREQAILQALQEAILSLQIIAGYVQNEVSTGIGMKIEGIEGLERVLSILHDAGISVNANQVTNAKRN